MVTHKAKITSTNQMQVAQRRHTQNTEGGDKSEDYSLSASCAPLLTASFTMDVSEDPALVQQLDSSQEGPAIHDPVEEDHSSVNFVGGEKFSLYSDLKKKLSEFEESKSVQMTHRDSQTELSNLQLRGSQRELKMLIQHWYVYCTIPSISPVCTLILRGL